MTLRRAVPRPQSAPDTTRTTRAVHERAANRGGESRFASLQGVRYEDPDGVTRGGRVAVGRACRNDGRGRGAEQRYVESDDAEQRKRVGSGDHGYGVRRFDGYAHVVGQGDADARADAAFATLFDRSELRHILRQLALRFNHQGDARTN